MPGRSPVKFFQRKRLSTEDGSATAVITGPAEMVGHSLALDVTCRELSNHAHLVLQLEHQVDDGIAWHAVGETLRLSAVGTACVHLELGDVLRVRLRASLSGWAGPATAMFGATVTFGP